MARCKIKALVFKDMDSYIKNFCKLVLLAPPGSFMDSEWVNRFCEKLPSRYHDLIHDIQQKNIIDNFEEVVQEACNFENGNMAVQSQFADCTTKDSSGRQSTCFDAWKKRTKHASMHTLHMVSMVDHLPKINIHLPDGLRVFMLVDTGASHNYVAGDFLEFLRKNGTHITECKCGLEVIQTASGEITTASKLVTLLLIIARQWTRAKFVWHDDEPAPRLKLLINGHVVQVSCDMSTKDSAMKPPRRRSPAEDRAIHDFINERIVYFCTQCELTPREYCYLDHIEQPTALERLTTDASDGKLAIKPGMAEAVAESIACKGHSTWLSIEQKVLSIAETAVRNSVSTEEALPSVDTARLDDGNVAKALQKVEHWVLQLFVEDSHLFCLNKLGSRNENTADALHMMENLIYRIIYISPYHPQTNGKVERFNGILLNALNHHPRFQFQATDNASDAPNASRNHELEARSARARHFDKF
ncbi:hypothetical protein NDA12_003339 [Ustilago hordei]|nr:hypothetical protein NDA12_003339 [Ustilago hordei]